MMEIIGSNTNRKNRTQPISSPRMVPGTAPIKKLKATLSIETKRCSSILPLWKRRTTLTKMREGGGKKTIETNPEREMISHKAIAPTTGTTISIVRLNVALARLRLRACIDSLSPNELLNDEFSILGFVESIAKLQFPPVLPGQLLYGEAPICSLLTFETLSLFESKDFEAC